MFQVDQCHSLSSHVETRKGQLKKHCHPNHEMETETCSNYIVKILVIRCRDNKSY